MKVSLVGCWQLKLDVPAKARDLYRSSLFKSTLRYAESTSERTFIISAKYGLLELEQVIAPYEMRVADLPKLQRFLWAERVVDDLVHRLGERIEVRLLSGSEYALPIRRALVERQMVVESPLHGLTIGYRLQWLKEHTR